jgi:hypothetical protein
MRFDLYIESSRQLHDPGEPMARFKRLEIEEEVRHPMAPSKRSVLPAAIRAIDISLLSWPK